MKAVHVKNAATNTWSILLYLTTFGKKLNPTENQKAQAYFADNASSEKLKTSNNSLTFNYLQIDQIYPVATAANYY